MSIITAAVLHPVTEEGAQMGEATPAIRNDVTHCSESECAHSGCLLICKPLSLHFQAIS